MGEGECEGHLKDGQHVAVDDLSDFLFKVNKRETDE